MGYGEKLLKHFQNLELVINPVPKIKIEGLPDDSQCTGCRFFQSKEEAIAGEPFEGYYNRKSHGKGFCLPPYKVDKMDSCAWVDFGCVNQKEKVK